tara:strand:- start:77 stop:307 length:231 start_codon:yes stop_codon:yes gene_type:complete
MAAVVGRGVFTVNRWFTDVVAIHQRGAGRVKLFIWAITSPLWVPLWLIYEYTFGLSPTVYEDDPYHDDFSGDTDDD